MERCFPENSDVSISPILHWEIMVRGPCIQSLSILKKQRRKEINDMETEMCRLTEIYKRS